MLVLLYAPPHGLSRALAHCPRPTSQIIKNNNSGTQIAELQSPRIHPTGTGGLPQMRIQVGQHVTPELPQRCCILRDHCGISNIRLGLFDQSPPRHGASGYPDTPHWKCWWARQHHRKGEPCICKIKFCETTKWCDC